MSNELELKPCPYCGGEDLLTVWKGDDIFCHVECSYCEMSGQAALEESDAIDLWNYMPRVLVWSSEPPNIPGWYFTHPNRPGNPLGVVYVKREKRFDIHGKNPRYFMTMASLKSEIGDIIENLGQPDRLWAGPIPEPLSKPKEANR